MLGKAPTSRTDWEEDVVQGDVVRVVIVGVEGQDAAGQLVHDVPAGVLHDHVLGESGGQLPGPVHDLVEAVQLPLGGEEAHEQQEGHLLKAKGARLPVGLHDFVEFDAAVVQLSGYRDTDAVLNHVAQHGTHPGHANGHAGAVAVAQAPLHVFPVVLLADVVLPFHALAQGTCILFQEPGLFCLHGVGSPFVWCFGDFPAPAKIGAGISVDFN